ncbi:MAG: 2-oxoacid:ferredoxin oxidoreductase subunit beta [Gemmatimonadota bacterium]|nr:2-oxoacid:ferredoxin oxidoreductase subunit beta [Gemmatimonadota bacterium]MDH3427046.1 2-oxoacid:ferredoxin oxidoreductase subunit beta [Gemmatimonadota bacterium]
MTPATRSETSAKDFASDQDVRWCPGCGDYAILKGVQKTLADVGASTENTVFVSGIGCAARFPYYMSTYGFHTIHGRAPALATGLKLANPDLDVWVVTGDGDALSIGGNHTLHVLRRNVDLQILLFNNEIYGLTKGQASPTSRRGTVTPSTPRGSFSNPVHPASFAIGAGARFVARGIDINLKLLTEVLKAAHEHRGASFVEIFQNCIVFNDGCFSEFTDKAHAGSMQLVVENGKPLRFGPDGNRGLRFNPRSWKLETVDVGPDGVAVEDLVVHDETNRALALLLAELQPPDAPMALGVLYRDPAESYHEAMLAGVPAAGASLSDLLRTGKTWTVEG